MKFSELINQPGVGWSNARRIWCGIDIYIKNISVSFLSLNVYQNALRLILMKEHRLVNFLKQTTHIKGRKYIFKLPVRGQRTHTNSRTVKNVILG